MSDIKYSVSISQEPTAYGRANGDTMEASDLQQFDSLPAAREAFLNAVDGFMEAGYGAESVDFAGIYAHSGNSEVDIELATFNRDPKDGFSIDGGTDLIPDGVDPSYFLSDSVENVPEGLEETLAGLVDKAEKNADAELKADIETEKEEFMAASKPKAKAKAKSKDEGIEL